MLDGMGWDGLGWDRMESIDGLINYWTDEIYTNPTQKWVGRIDLGIFPKIDGLVPHGM